MIPAVRLGLRFLRGRELVLRLRTVLAAVASALCVMLLLGIAAAWHVGRVAETRNVAQAPRPDSHGGLLYGVVEDRWHGGDLTRVYLAAVRPHAPIPPGIGAVPRPGQVWLSPDLAHALADHDRQLEARFGGLQLAGVIGRTGLTSAADQRAYIGAPPGALDGRLAVRVGGFNYKSGVTRTPGHLKFLTLLLFLIFVAVPFAAVCAVATRLGAAARRRRMAALWMIGLRPWELRLAAATEASIAVLTGAVVGVAGYQALRPAIADHSINGLRPFNADLAVPGLLQCLVVAAVTLVALVSGTLLSGSRGWQAPRPRVQVRRFSLLPLALVAAGVVLAVVMAASQARNKSSLNAPLLEAVAATLLIGCTLALAAVLQRGARWMASVLPSGVGLIAARRLETDPGAMARIAALVVPTVFAIGFAATIATQFDLSETHARNDASLGGQQVGYVSNTLSAISTAPLHPHGIDAEIAIPVLHGNDERGTPFSIVRASCSQLAQLTGKHNLPCGTGRFLLTAVDPQEPAWQRRTAHRPHPPAGGHMTITLAAHTSINVPYPTRRLVIPLSPAAGLTGTSIVIPNHDPATASLTHAHVDGIVVAVPANTPAAEQALRASIARTNPYATVQMAGESEIADNSRYARYGTTVLLLALITCIIGAAGIAMTALDTILTRLRQLTPLLVIGIPRSALRRATALETAAPLLIATALGVAIATVCGALLQQHTSHEGHLAVHTLALEGTFGAVGAALIAAAAALLVPASPNQLTTQSE